MFVSLFFFSFFSFLNKLLNNFRRPLLKFRGGIVFATLKRHGVSMSNLVSFFLFLTGYLNKFLKMFAFNL